LGGEKRALGRKGKKNWDNSAGLAMNSEKRDEKGTSKSSKKFKKFRGTGHLRKGKKSHRERIGNGKEKADHERHLRGREEKQATLVSSVVTIKEGACRKSAGQPIWRPRREASPQAVRKKRKGVRAEHG